MRRIYYVPEGLDIEDFRLEWEGHTNEVHSGLSPNIENYVKNVDEAGFVFIPEFQILHTPVNASDAEYWQVAYVNDFADRNNSPQYILEVWKKNLDNPSEQQILVDKHILQFDIGADFFHTDHIRLPIGWYDLVLKFEDEEIDTKEISIYEAINEEE
ncbi:MAG: hypothetical protein VW235_03190 [Rhodospirillaceae bacterium]